MKNLRILLAIVILTLAGRCGVASGQTLTTLYNFSFGFSADGEAPEAGLVQGSDGNFYGTTSEGGTNYNGTVFKISSAGTLTTLYSFSGGADGAWPKAGLVQGSDSNFYGTTPWGGASGDGTVFKISSAGTLTTLYSFSGGADGAWPYAGLVQGGDSNFYGTTRNGGASGYGTVFKISSAGTLTTLHTFSGGADGARTVAGLVQGSDSNFYGTTSEGGASGDGTAFKISSAGTLTTLHSFSGGADGGYPYAGLVQGSDGNYYGTTSQGGTSTTNCYNFCGTVFKMSSAGTLTTLYSFSGGADGYDPRAGLVQGTDGNFYGTTRDGGAGGGATNAGTVFKMSSAGTLTTLHSFSGGADGAWPEAGLVQGSDGNFYGTTIYGGASGAGTVFMVKWAEICNVSAYPMVAYGVCPGPGGDMGTVSGAGAYDCGSNVTVCAYPSSCYQFTGWYETGNWVSDSPCYTFTLNTNRFLEARFTQMTVDINLFSWPWDSGSISSDLMGPPPTQMACCGQWVDVWAHPNPCYTFANWTDGSGSIVSTSSWYAFTATNFCTLMANFTPLPVSHNISAVASCSGGGPSDCGTITGAGAYNCGSNVTVCAYPSSSYTFTSWTENGYEVDWEPCYTFTVNGDRNLVAKFTAVDSVGDTIPDWWRAQYFGAGGTNTNSVSCATCDADGTGQNNLFKYVAGLDPTNRASVFMFSAASVSNQPAQFNLVFSPVVAGRTYTPQFTTNLVGIAYAPLTGIGGPTTNGTEATVTDLNAVEAQKFYRIRISLP